MDNLPAIFWAVLAAVVATIPITAKVVSLVMNKKQNGSGNLNGYESYFRSEFRDLRARVDHNSEEIARMSASIQGIQNDIRDIRRGRGGNDS